MTTTSTTLLPMGKRILVMTARPDDATFLMSGTIARLPAVDHGYTFAEAFHTIW